MEPCSTALCYAYKWLYAWNQSKAEDLADYLNEIPYYDKKKKKMKNYFNAKELDKLIKMKQNNDLLKEFDITLFYKVIF